MQSFMETFPLSVDEYLDAEEESGIKHEYVNGFVYAMVGSSRRHNLLSVALAAMFKNHLQGTGCQIFVADMKVKAGGKKDNIFFYPDVMVTCNRHLQNRYVEEEPKLIVEVLSPSTEQHDRLSKLEAYTKIATLEEYLLVDQNEMKIDLYRRVDNRWKLLQYSESSTLELASVDFRVPVTDVYQDVIGLI